MDENEKNYKESKSPQDIELCHIFLHYLLTKSFIMSREFNTETDTRAEDEFDPLRISRWQISTHTQSRLVCLIKRSTNVVGNVHCVVQSNNTTIEPQREAEHNGERKKGRERRLRMN